MFTTRSSINKTRMETKKIVIRWAHGARIRMNRNEIKKYFSENFGSLFVCKFDRGK